MSRIFFSHVLGPARLPFAATPPADSLTSDHWEDLASSYRDGLLACGKQIVDVLRPEIYSTDIAKSSLGVLAQDWHLVVKPIEHIRPFHGMANVFVSDWPFALLSSRTGGISPFFHQLRLLNRATAVACCTEATNYSSTRGRRVARDTCPAAPPYSKDENGSAVPLGASYVHRCRFSGSEVSAPLACPTDPRFCIRLGARQPPQTHRCSHWRGVAPVNDVAG